MSSRLRVVALVLVLGLLAVELAVLVDWGAVTHATYGQVGTIDFSSYWTAFQAARQGLDPYDPAVVGPMQEALGREEYTIIMFNPPWMLGFLAPVLAVPFAQAAPLWLALNLAMAAAIGVLVSRGGRVVAGAAFAALLFVPAWEAMKWGQASVFIALGAAGAWWAWKQERPLLCGVFLAVAACKPHLPFLFGWVCILQAVRDRRWGVFGGAALAGGGALGLALAMSPGVVGHWLDSFVSLEAEGQTFASTDWVTASLPSVLAALLGSADAPARWPLVVIPGLAALGVTVGSVTRRIDVGEHGPWLLAASALLGPYAWFYDGSILLPLHVLTVGWALARRDRLALAVVGGFQLVVVAAQGAGLASAQHHFWWVPMGVLGIAWWVKGRSGLVPSG